MADTSKNVLVTGGAGYIGSHTVLELIKAGWKVTVVDNLSNSSRESLVRVASLAGLDGDVALEEVDMLDEPSMRRVFSSTPFSAVVHFAGLKAVGESNEKPLQYYHNNITGTLIMLNLMREFGVGKLVFSSSATVYGLPEKLPIDESHPLRATNPYGRTKLFIEDILRDACKADKGLDVVLLRYFNPTGAHESGRIGEDPGGIPNNLMPFVAQVAIGRREKLSVFGGDWDTRDGTGVRDFIHVVDLALGHLAALDKLGSGELKGCTVYNLGTGTGYSVLEMVKAFEEASGRKVPYEIVGRREGDIGSCYGDVGLAREKLGWVARRGLKEMVDDMWRWQRENPNGYAKPE